MDLKGICVVEENGRRTPNGDIYFGIISDFNDQNVQVIWNDGTTDLRCISTCGLLVFDLAPTGVSHEGVTCDLCKSTPIAGMRWKCGVCYDFDLCSSCYHGNKHDLNHIFHQICVPGTNPFNCGKRDLLSRDRVVGFFPGAKVKRGSDWEWGNQDGGVGKYGTVISHHDYIGAFNKKCVRSGVTVLWDQHKNRNNYRIGFQGKMDLICVTPGVGGYYYKQHLPKLESFLKMAPTKRAKTFHVGDIVTIDKDVETLCRLQPNHGGVTKELFGHIGKVGHVIEVLPQRNSVVVMFDSQHDRLNELFSVMLNFRVQRQQRENWLINSLALKKVEPLVVNDKVKVIDDPDLLMLVQKNIGVYRENLELLHGKEGVVVKPFDGKSVQVKFGTDRQLVVAMSVAAINKQEVFNHGEAFLDLLLKAFVDAKEEELRNSATEQESPTNMNAVQQEEHIVNAAFVDDINTVRKILNEKPYMVNAMKNGKTALHIATLQDNEDIIALLLEKGADVTLKTDDGDTVLHCAAVKGNNSVGRLFIRRRCPGNSKNKNGVTPLHVAVQKDDDDFVRMLISHKCDPNIQDEDGNTPLHIACDKGNFVTTEIILSAGVPNCDITILNKMGLNALHLAAYRNKLEIVQAIVAENPGAINITKLDGSTALHIAAQNGNDDVIAFLLDFYKAGGLDTKVKTRNGLCPLHIACIEGFLSTVKILLEHGVDINEAAADGDTSLHLCIRKQLLLCNLPQALQTWDVCPDLKTVKSHFNNHQTSGIVIACFLIENGASLDYLNNQGLNAIDLCENDNLRKLLLEFAKKQQDLMREVKGGADRQPDLPGGGKLEREISEDVCLMCKEPVEGRFQPCGHAVYCYDHADCMRKCPQCKVAIEKVTRLSIERLPDCIICSDVRVNMTFQPCGHQIACYECGKRFKKCLSCKADITTRAPICDIPQKDKQPKCEKQNDDNEGNLCNICFERKRDSVFLCGHGACKVCAYALRECHICRVAIEKIIKLYDN